MFWTKKRHFKVFSMVLVCAILMQLSSGLFANAETTLMYDTGSANLGGGVADSGDSTLEDGDGTLDSGAIPMLRAEKTATPMPAGFITDIGIFEGIDKEGNGTPFADDKEFKQDEIFYLKYKYTIPTNPVDSGTSAIVKDVPYFFTIPEKMDTSYTPLPFFEIKYNDKAAAKAEVTSEKKVVVTFNKYAEDEKLLVPGTDGYFWFLMKFDKDKVDNSGKQEVIFTKPANDGDIKKEINFAIDKVEAKVNMEKSATLNLAALDATSIDWTVKATANITDPKNPNVTPAVPATITDLVITDEIEAPLVYNNGAITVKKHKAVNDTTGTEITPSCATYDTAEKTITITIPSGNSLKHGEYYTIKYNTTFSFSDVFKDVTTIKFTNTAKTKGFNHTQYVKDADGKTETKVGVPATGDMPSVKETVPLSADFLTKEGALKGGEINWTVTINPGTFTFTGGTITDTIPEGLTLKEDSVKWGGSEVAKSTVTPPAEKSGKYSISPSPKNNAKDKTTLTYAMGELKKDPKVLTYTTTVDSGYAWLDNFFVNNVNFNPENGPKDGFSKNATVHYGASVFSKKAGDYIPSTHTIPWEITMGEVGGTELLNPTVTEVLPEGLTLVGSIKVGVKEIKVDETITVGDGAEVKLTKETRDSKTALVFKFTGTIKGVHRITFNTTVEDEKYWAANDKNSGEKNELANTAYLAVEGMKKHTVTAKPEVPSQILAKAKGESYDHTTKQASWVLTINQNQMAMESPTITDTLDTAGLSFVEESVVVTLKKGNTSTEITPSSLAFSNVGGKPTMTLVLPSVEASAGEYIVKYKTAVADNILQQPAPKIANIAVLSSITFPEMPATVTVTQDIAKPLVAKTGVDKNGEFYIEWTVMINQNGTELNKPIIKDVLANELTLDPSSIKLKELELNADGVVVDTIDVTDSKTAIFAVEVENSEKVFTASFANTITKPYMLIFNTYYEKDAVFSNSVELVAEGGIKFTADSDNVAGGSAAGGGGTSPRFGDIVIIKTTEDTPAAPLQGAAFKLGNLTKTTAANGEVVFYGARLGQSYTITEVKAPYGFELLTAPIDVKVDKFDAQNQYRHTVTNKRITNDLTVTKKDDKTPATPLNDAEFTVTRASGNENDNISFDNVVITSGKTTTLKTEADSGDNAGKFVTSVDATATTAGTEGEAKLVGLPVGEYTVTETKAPSGYVLNSQPKTVTISSDGKVQAAPQEISFTNVKILGSLELTKTDTAGKPLEGAEFSVKGTGTLVFEKTIKTGANGIATLEGLPVGSYIVTETKAPSGYVLNTTPQSFTIENDVAVITTPKKLTFANEKIEGVLTVTKTDAADPTKTLQGAVYTATKTDAPNSGEKWSETTNEKGVATFKLAAGRYSIAETKAPKGYVLNSQPKTVTISSDGKVQAKPQEISFTNVKILGSLELTKTDDTANAKPLEGAEFSVKGTGTPVFEKTIKTGVNGIATLAGLPVGSYIVTEIKAPSGYVLNATPQTFIIEDDVAVQATPKKLTFANEKIEGVLTVTKTDAADPTKTLQGAVYTATKTDAPNRGAKWSETTNENGVATFKLAAGTYSIEETTAPKGYVLNSQPKTVTISSDGKVQAAPQKISFTNVKILGSLELTKTDDTANAKPLEGAEFELYNADGDVLLAVGVTGKDGKLSFAKLPAGNYYYKEKKAPTGYVKDETKHTFSITTHGQIVTETLKNKAAPPSSNNSGGGNTPSASPPPEVIIVPPQTVPPTQVPGITPPELGTTPEVRKGTIEITPTGTPDVKVPPANGTVTIDKDGKWVYTPNMGFVGEDEFTITATYPSGYTETFVIKLSVLGGYAQFLPETGEAPRTMFYVGGMLLIVLGVVIKRKLKKI